MGMYTELHYNATLEASSPQEVIDILSYMVNNEKQKPTTLPDHPLFATPRWEYMLTMDSYYFSADTHSTFRLDRNIDYYYLCIRCNLKNYSDEIGLFIAWLDPYIHAFEGDFLGFYRYEEEEEPTIIKKQV